MTMDVGFLTADAGEMCAGIKWDIKSKDYFDAHALNKQWESQAFPTFNRAFNRFRPKYAPLHNRYCTKRRAYLIKASGIRSKCRLPPSRRPASPSRRQKLSPRFLAQHHPVLGIWIFDCATLHTAFAEDALRATNMNKGIGGEKKILRDGWFMNDAGEKVIQPM